MVVDGERLASSREGGQLIKAHVPDCLRRASNHTFADLANATVGIRKDMLAATGRRQKALEPRIPVTEPSRYTPHLVNVERLAVGILAPAGSTPAASSDAVLRLPDCTTAASRS